MKVRTDYVSNSSSSSFLICLPKPIENLKVDEFIRLCKTKDQKVGEDEGWDSGRDINAKYFKKLFDDEYWGTPFKLDDGRMMYNVCIHDSNQGVYQAVMMEAQYNKDLIPYWKYDS